MNSYCIFPGGITGLFRSGFDLVVGLTLVADLSVVQLAGVLAHELGHAAQANIGSSRFISSVHAWLSRVAFERDEVDEHLLKRLATAGPGTRLGLRLSQVLIQAAGWCLGY